MLYQYKVDEFLGFHFVILGSLLYLFYIFVFFLAVYGLVWQLIKLEFKHDIIDEICSGLLDQTVQELLHVLFAGLIESGYL